MLFPEEGRFKSRTVLAVIGLVHLLEHLNLFIAAPDILVNRFDHFSSKQVISKANFEATAEGTIRDLINDLIKI